MNALLPPETAASLKQTRTVAPRKWQALAGQLGERAGAFWTLGVLALIVLGLGLANRNFFSRASWLATSVFGTEVLIVALGQTFVMITAGIDLSVGAVLGFSAMCSAWVMEQTMLSGLSTLATMAIGTVVAISVGVTMGLINGTLITRLRLAPFIATLGTMGFTAGGTLVINGGREIDRIPSQWSELGNSVLAGWFPFPVIVAGILCLAMWLILSQTVFGRHVYAIGSHAEAARRAGIRVEKTLVVTYALGGFMAAVSGLLVMSRFGIAHPSFGANDLLASIAAVVIGGTSLFGGRGTIPGSIIGTAILSVLVTGLVLAGVQPYWQTVAVGAIIIAAVYVDQLRGGLRGVE